MRHTSLVAYFLTASLTTGCTLIASPTIPKAATPSGPSTSTTTTPSTESTPAPSPFPRLNNPTDGQPLVVADYYADATSSLTVSDVTISGGTDSDADGAPNYVVQGQVDLGDWGVHDVEIDENDSPASGGQLDRYVVMDKTATSSFTFELTPDNGNGIITHGDSVLTFLFNDDGTVTLNDGERTSMEEAAQQVAGLASAGEVSPHAIALLYARLLRSPVDTTQPSYNVTSFEQWVLGNRASLQSFLLLILQILLSMRFL